MNTEACQKLADAIVIQAAKDYRVALKRQKRNPYSETARRTISEVERFFRSKWYKSLTEIEGEYLIGRLRKEVGA
jgi:hypothetical protein